MHHISRVNQSLAGGVGSAQDIFKISRVESGRVGTFSSISGRVGSGQKVSLPLGLGRVGSGHCSNSQVGSGGLEIFSSSCGSGRFRSAHTPFGSGVGSGQLARPDPTRPDP